MREVEQEKIKEEDIPYFRAIINGEFSGYLAPSYDPQLTPFGRDLASSLQGIVESIAVGGSLTEKLKSYNQTVFSGAEKKEHEDYLKSSFYYLTQNCLLPFPKQIVTWACNGPNLFRKARQKAKDVLSVLLVLHLRDESIASGIIKREGEYLSLAEPD